MTTTPDPKLVHEIAEDAMRGAIADGMFWHVNQAVGDHGVPGLVFKGSAFEVHRIAAIAEYKRMADALSWPNERDGGAMSPADVPDTWLQTAFDAIGRSGTGDGDEQMRHVLAAVAPLCVRQEQDGAAQAVAEAVSILEGMLNEDAWAYDAGRARNVLLDYFARDLDALDVRDAKAGGSDA